MKKVLSFIYNAPLAPTIFFTIILVVPFLFRDCLFSSITNEQADGILQEIEVFISIITAFALLEVTARIGYGQIQAQREAAKINNELVEMQIELQMNAQRISLFDKYATIYNAYIEDMTSLDFYEQAFLINPQQFDPMEHFNSKLVKVVNESRLLLTEKECIAIGTIGTYLNEIKHPMDFISKRAKEDNIQLDVDWGQILYIDNRSKITNEQITERFYAVIQEYRLANEDAIDAIKQRRARIKKIAEENNLELVLERYCNINNILKH